MTDLKIYLALILGFSLRPYTLNASDIFYFDINTGYYYVPLYSNKAASFLPEDSLLSTSTYKNLNFCTLPEPYEIEPEYTPPSLNLFFSKILKNSQKNEESTMIPFFISQITKEDLKETFNLEHLPHFYCENPGSLGNHHYLSLRSTYKTKKGKINKEIYSVFYRAQAYFLEGIYNNVRNGHLYEPTSSYKGFESILSKVCTGDYTFKKSLLMPVKERLVLAFFFREKSKGPWPFFAPYEKKISLFFKFKKHYNKKPKKTKEVKSEGRPL